jgi:hypothetical protein
VADLERELHVQSVVDLVVKIHSVVEIERRDTVRGESLEGFKISGGSREMSYNQWRI